MSREIPQTTRGIIRPDWLTSLSSIREIEPFSKGNILVSFITMARVLAIVVITMAVLVLLGWWQYVHILGSLSTSFPQTRFNNALALFMGGLIVFFDSFSVATSTYKEKILYAVKEFIISVLAFLLLGLSIASLIQYFYMVDLGIDYLFFPRIYDASSNLISNRIAPNMALVHIMVAVTAIQLRVIHKQSRFHHFFMVIAGLILAPSLVGEVYDVDFIFGAATGTKPAMTTILAACLLVVAYLFSRPNRGFMKVIASSGAGGYLARRLLLMALVIPFILGWLVLQGNRLGLYDTQFRFLLLVSLFILTFTLIIWRTIASLHQLEAQRQLAERNVLFLAAASKVLASSLDHKITLQNVADLAVPHIADWFSVEVLDDHGLPQVAALAHKDHSKVRWARALRKNNPPNLNDKVGLAKVLKTGKSEFYPLITDKMLQDAAKNKRDLALLQQIGFSSVIISPIVSEQKVLGAIQLVTAESGRLYTPSDLAMAEELASRVALALRNAQLYKNTQTALRLRDEFISLASHELKTPITSLNLYLQVLEKRFKKQDTKLASYLTKMNTQVGRLTTLIADLLDVSKIQARKLIFEMTDFDVNELVKDIVFDLQSTTKHSITIEGKASKHVHADQDRIGQVVINLITNAIKYSPAAKPITISFTNQEDTVTVAVQDLGRGIEAKDQDRIFDRFYQVKSANSAGLGLGLYISQEIMKRHGQSLMLKSAKNRGSTFSFTLPFAR